MTSLLAGLELGRQLRSIRLRDRVVFVTGGSRGLGLILARRFGEEGARVAICARNPEELRTAERELARQRISIFAVRCDIGERSEVESAIQQTVDHFGRLDVLVNNAGIIQVGPFDTMEEKDFQEMFRISFFGALYAIKSALPHLARRDGARIVNITSIGAAVPVPHLAPYTAAKFAVLGLSLSLREELALKRIKVVTVLPGLMRTGSYLMALFKGKREQELNWFAAGAAAPLVSLDAERAARQIVNACRRGDPYITLGMPFKVARILFSIFPGLVSDLMGFVNRLLPRAEAGGAEKGELHQTRFTARSRFTRLGRRAAARYQFKLDPLSGTNAPNYSSNYRK